MQPHPDCTPMHVLDQMSLRGPADPPLPTEMVWDQPAACEKCQVEAPMELRYYQTRDKVVSYWRCATCAFDHFHMERYALEGKHFCSCDNKWGPMLLEQLRPGWWYCDRCKAMYRLFEGVMGRIRGAEEVRGIPDQPLTGTKHLVHVRLRADLVMMVEDRRRSEAIAHVEQIDAKDLIKLAHRANTTISIYAAHPIAEPG